jgi:hypothetical protein
MRVVPIPRAHLPLDEKFYFIRLKMQAETDNLSVLQHNPLSVTRSMTCERGSLTGEFLRVHVGIARSASEGARLVRQREERALDRQPVDQRLAVRHRFQVLLARAIHCRGAFFPGRAIASCIWSHLPTAHFGIGFSHR